MKKKLVEMKYTLAVMIAVFFASTIFVSCGSDKEEVNFDELNYYTVEFATEGGASSELFNEISLIKETFYTQLGIQGDATNFMFKGTTEKCDARVFSCCRAAEAKLIGKVWTLRHVFYVKRLVTENGVNRQKVIFTYDTGVEK